MCQFWKKKLQEKLDEIGEESNNILTDKMHRKIDTIVEGNGKLIDLWKIRKQILNKNEKRIAIKNTEGKLLTDEQEIINRYQEYNKNLLKARPPKVQTKEFVNLIEQQFKLNYNDKNYEDDEINKKFELNELKNQIKNLKNGKAPGPDELTNEVIKNMGESMINNMLDMINYIWEKEEVPEDLMKIQIKSIYKGKGDISELKNQRGLFLGNNIYKLIEKLILGRISTRIENGFTETQIGGRKERSPAEQIFILRSVIEYFIYQNKPLYIQFMDLVKAFDTMVLKSVLLDLWKINIKGKAWRMIYILNKKSIVKIITGVGVSEESEIGESVKQGTVLATSLAALHTDNINTYFKGTGLGIYYGNINIQNLLFQDDIVRLENNATNLNKANKINEVYQNIKRMEFHQDKTVCMTLKGKDQIKLNNREIKNVKTYKYLGDIVTSDGKYDEMIKQRGNVITGATIEIINIIKSIENINIHKIIIYYNAIILSRLTYNSEAWGELTKSNIEALEKIQNKALKRLLNLPQSTPSKGLLHELGIPSIYHIIAKKKIIFMKKILTFKPENLTRRIFEEQAHMPGKTWRKSTNNLIEELNISNIKTSSKNNLKNTIKKSIKANEEKQFQLYKTQSQKCKNITTKFSTPDYIKSLPLNEAITILKLKLEMTDVKTNYKNKYGNLKCEACNEGEPEDVQHLIKCKTVSKILAPNEKIILEHFYPINKAQNTSQLKNLALCVQKIIRHRDYIVKNCDSEKQQLSPDHSAEDVKETEELLINSVQILQT